MKSVHDVICGLIRQGLSASCPTASKGSPKILPALKYEMLPWQQDYDNHYNSLEHASNNIVFIDTSFMQIITIGTIIII